MKLRMGSALLSLAGIFVAAYLWLYKQGRIGSIVCGTGGCETVQFSRWSEFLGVDVALIGILGYAVLLGIALAGVQRPAARWPGQWMAVLAGGGVLFASYLTWLELVVIDAICRWCVGSAVIITLIFVLALLDLRRHPGANTDPGVEARGTSRNAPPAGP
jgi:uncharacterized membrane protein